MNPLVPTAGEIATQILAVVHMVMFVIAVVKIVKAQWLSPGNKISWALVGFFIPVVGPLAALWFVRPMASCPSPQAYFEAREAQQTNPGAKQAR